MSSSEVAVRVQDVSKCYTISHETNVATTAAEAIMSRLRDPFRRVEKETFWALKGISFDLLRGEVLGVIGRNGAGKSTLLKILSRITQLTTGQIDIYGKVGSLLEVGTGFHPELTGRENISLNGTILGMSRKEIARQFDAIVDFAGVEQFLDTPVKRYSSGMYVRLAFAVAAHLSSEILIVDEVLSVGDAQFQKKCLGKIKHVAQDGRTVLFVSHQMQAVSALCTRAMCLQDGRVAFSGDAATAIGVYMQSRQSQPELVDHLRRRGSGELRITSFELDQRSYYSTEDIRIDMSVDVIREGQPSYFISLEVVNQFGIPVLHLDSRLLKKEFSGKNGARMSYVVSSPRLAQGDYVVNAYVCSTGGVIDAFDQAAEFAIAPVLPYPASRSDCAAHAIVYPEFRIDEAPLESGRIEEIAEWASR